MNVGLLEGESDGTELGLALGSDVMGYDGLWLGPMEGKPLGLALELVGEELGIALGSDVMRSDGLWLGLNVSNVVGLFVGFFEGELDGLSVGFFDGSNVGLLLGFSVVGELLGPLEGE